MRCLHTTRIISIVYHFSCQKERCVYLDGLDGVSQFIDINFWIETYVHNIITMQKSIR